MEIVLYAVAKKLVSCYIFYYYCQIKVIIVIIYNIMSWHYSNVIVLLIIVMYVYN